MSDLPAIDEFQEMIRPYAGEPPAWMIAEDPPAWMIAAYYAEITKGDP